MTEQNRNKSPRETDESLENENEAWGHDALNAAMNALNIGGPTVNYDNWLQEEILPPSNTFDITSTGPTGPAEPNAYSLGAFDTPTARGSAGDLLDTGIETPESESLISTPSKPPRNLPSTTTTTAISTTNQEPDSRTTEVATEPPTVKQEIKPEQDQAIEPVPEAIAKDTHTTPYAPAKDTHNALYVPVDNHAPSSVRTGDPAQQPAQQAVPETPRAGEPKTPVTPPEHDPELDEFYRQFSKSLTLESTETDHTLVLLSPLSYRHVFGRDWVSKRYKSSIVERPERLMACSIGIGCAMAALPSKFKLDVCTNRTSLTSEHVVKVHGPSWGKKLYELCENSQKLLDNGQIEVPNNWHYGDIYLGPETILALEGVVGAVETAVDRVFSPTESTKRAFVSIRPPGHHSHPCVPSGFCLINNVHIAIQYAARQHNVSHAVILDFDLHHGDGSQDICFKLAGLGDDDDSNTSDDTQKDTAGGPKIGYFSIHDVNSFPSEAGFADPQKIKESSVRLMNHGLCIWNIHMEPYNGKEEFMRLYNEEYRGLFKRARQFLSKEKAIAESKGLPFNPLVLLSAGFDGSEYETGSMQRHAVYVPTEFFHMFTKDAVELASEYSKGRVVSLLEGGYSDGALSTGVLSHLGGLAGAPWDPEWGSPANVKELEKGCKLKYSPPSKSNARPNLPWLVNGIQLGRTLWPSETRQRAMVASTVKKGHSYLVEGLVTPSRVLRDRTKLQTPR